MASDPVEMMAKAMCAAEADEYGFGDLCDRDEKWRYEAASWRFRARAALTALEAEGYKLTRIMVKETRPGIFKFTEDPGR